MQIHASLHDRSLIWDIRNEVHQARIRDINGGNNREPDLNAVAAETVDFRIAYFACPSHEAPEPFPARWGPIRVYSQPLQDTTVGGGWRALRDDGIRMWQRPQRIPAPGRTSVTLGMILHAIHDYLNRLVYQEEPEYDISMRGWIRRNDERDYIRRMDFLASSRFEGIGLSRHDGEFVLQLSVS